MRTATTGNITSGSSGSGQPDLSGYKGPIISNSVVPVEIFVIFLLFNKKHFTVCDIINKFEEAHRHKLKFDRVQQICIDLVNARKIQTYQAKNKKNNVVAYYHFEKII